MAAMPATPPSRTALPALTPPSATSGTGTCRAINRARTAVSGGSGGALHLQGQRPGDSGVAVVAPLRGSVATVLRDDGMNQAGAVVFVSTSARQDVVPGRYNILWFKPTLVGTYPLLCTEFCGTADRMNMHDIPTGNLKVLPVCPPGVEALPASPLA